MKCSKKKPASEFYTNGRRPDGSVRLRSICKLCGSYRKLVETRPKKRCSDCGEIKPTSEFGKQGLYSYCRSCSNIRSDAYKRGKGRRAHIDRMSRYQKEKYASDPEYRKKVRARHEVYQAVKLGVLKRPDHCPRCGRKVKPQAHHHNGYDKAHWLDVEWMCGRCHYATHTRE